MLIEVSKEDYKMYFPTDNNPFTSEEFIALVENKTEKVIRLIKEDDTSIGLILGLKDGVLTSPFSAPFGGFHYSHEYMNYSVLYAFLAELKDYVRVNNLKQVSVTLPPDMYQKNINAKLINAFIRLGYKMDVPDLTNWIDLKEFDGTWVKSVVAQNCRKAIKHGLSWLVTTDKKEMEECYDVIFRNREDQGRKIYMTLQDILKVKQIFPVDFIRVNESNGNCVGAGIFYRGHEKIVQAIFLGDDMEKRNWGTMNYMYQNCYAYYQELNYDYIDLGISSIGGEPNNGLIRFKELHNCTTSLRYTFTWSS